MSYPKPSPMGGTLIRKVLAQFKNQGFPLPIQNPIFVAVSGGVDSMVLAHLLARYGRKVVTPSLMTLLHFDHQWRAASGTTEKKAVEKLAKSLNIQVRSVQLEKPKKGVNLEDDARTKRQEQFDLLAGDQKTHQFVLTAHHQDDVVETLVWRFFRGEFSEDHQGILFQDHQILRPFLKVSKQEIYAYATQEKVPYFEDPTNASGEGMRSFLRNELIPIVESRFPGLKTSVAQYAHNARGKKSPAADSVVSVLEAVLSHGLNRTQRSQIEKLCQNIGKKELVGKQLSLPHGCVLEVQKDGFLIKNLDRLDIG